MKSTMARYGEELSKDAYQLHTGRVNQVRKEETPRPQGEGAGKKPGDGLDCTGEKVGGAGTAGAKNTGSKGR